MTDAKRDNNSVTVAIGVLNSDGATPTPVQASAAAHSVNINDGTTGSVNAKADARRDGNSVTTLLAQASDGSGTIELAVDSSGNLLTQST